MTRGAVFRYLGWQVWDRTGPRLFACVIIALAINWPLHYGIRESAPPPEQLRPMLAQLHQQFAFVYSLLLCGGLISQDRVMGFYRFYFAKPVSPSWFYAQHVTLALIGMLASSAVFVVSFSLLVQPAWHFNLLANSATLFLLVGMMCVVFSTLSKHDWLWTVIALVVINVLRARFPAEAGGAGRVLQYVLPPSHLIGADQDLRAWQWLWVGSWGAGLFAAALLLLARRPLGED
jgi:hypothetical protein